MRRGFAGLVLALLLLDCTSAPTKPGQAPSPSQVGELSARPARAGVPGRSTLWPPGLASESGWYVHSSGPLPPGTRAVPFAAASTIPFVEGPRIYPTSTAKKLPADGAVIYAGLPVPKGHPTQPNANFGPWTSRPQIGDFQIERRWEGQVAPNVPQYRLGVLKDRQEVDIHVWFGSQHPSAAAMKRAQRELATLSIPPFHPAPRTPEGRCPQDPSQGTYEPLVTSNSGPAGGTFELWGGMPTRLESGRYAGPTARMEFWWNLDIHSYWNAIGTGALPSPAAGGPVGLLGTRDRADHCNYQLVLTVPEVPPGVYTITGLELGGGGGTNFRPMTFHVTAPEG